MSDLRPIRRALISVSDKSGIVDFARAIAAHGAELVSTGGTARALREAGLEVRDISDLTGFPEMLDGRVKTLHPKVHGGLLGVEEKPEHASAMNEHAIGPIDLVCVNLYPFEATAAKQGVTRDELIEQIDIGGPSMIRSAAKNHDRVTVVTSASQYAGVLADLEAHGGRTSREIRRTLAVEAYRTTARYDAAIAGELGTLEANAPEYPERWTLPLERSSTLRYGENPHQSAALYKPATPPPPGVPALSQAGVLHGKALSYNNLNDASGAVGLVWDLHRADPDAASCVVVKHTNPCGAAQSADTTEAVRAALAGDPMAAYGGILATNRVIDEPTAEALCAKGIFLEVIAAAGFTEGALSRLRERSQAWRLLELGTLADVAPDAYVLKSIVGGDVLIQQADTLAVDTAGWVHAAGPAPSGETLAHARAVWLMCKHLSSNAIALGGADGGAVRLFGAGAGQMDRVASCSLAVGKAGDRAAGAIAASDAFFPFPDGPEVLIEAGVRTIVHPGGSKRDGETFALCDERGVTCLTTGSRHFRH